MKYLIALLGMGAAVFTGPRLSGYALQSGLDWPINAPITIQLQMQTGGAAISGALTDGSTSWNQVMQAVLSDWNQNLPSAMQLVPVVNSSAAIAGNNGINNVTWGSTVYGESWGTGGTTDTAGICIYWYTGAQRTEADVIFNSTLSWDSYRGALQHTSQGAVIHDIKRTALHEFGHVLGLTHPDSAGQSVTAVMNSVESSTDSLAADDIAGIKSIYTTPPAPTVLVQPLSQTASVGGSVSLSVTPAGAAPLTYQWYFNGTSMGATANGQIITISNLQLNSAGNYTVSLTNPVGSVTSQAAILTMTAGPVITTQPQSQTASAGATVTFTAAGSGPSNFQWQFNGSAIAGQTAATLTLTNITAANAGTYTVVVSNSGGSVTSNAAALTLAAAATPPAFTSQPQAATVVSGTTVVFSAATSGSPDPSLQWKLNGSAISGATGSRLVVSNAAAANAGTYTCTATNSAGTATSSGAALSLTTTTNVGRLINLSVNTFDGSGSQLLTMGFVTGGSGTTGSQTLLVRASGTPLTAYGVSGVLPDPTLAVHTTISGQDTVVASNAGWASTPSNQAAVTAADAATFAYPLTDPTSQDSATVVTLPTNPGYTVQVVGKSGDSGRTLAEIYDDTPGTYTAATPRLINVSCRIQVGAGSSLTEGFTVGGITSKTVLIRAIGPTLGTYGVGGVMPDPQLTVYSGQTAIASNSGWGGDPQLTAAMFAVYAFALPDPTSKDSVVLLTLAPGSYTAVASSATGTTGTTLVEVYEVP